MQKNWITEAKKGIFMVYDKRSPAYLVYHPDTDKIERVRCVKFFKEGNLQPMLVESY